MSYDLLIGISQARLNSVIGEVYASPGLRGSLFSGSQSGAYSGVSYTVKYSVDAAPSIALQPPTPAEWSQSIKAGGVPPAPVAGAFIVDLPSFAVQLNAVGDAVNSTIPVKAICTIASNGGSLTIDPISVIANLSQSSPMDKFIISSVLVPNVLTMLQKALSGIPIPRLNFAGISLTPPVVEISRGYLLTAFNLVKDGTPSIAGVAIPGDPFFALLSRELVQSAIDYEVRTNLQGKQFQKSGSEGAAGFSAGYNASGTITGISASTTTNPLSLHSEVSLSMSASAGISTPIGTVINAVGNVVSDVASGIASGASTVVNALNPTHW